MPLISVRALSSSTKSFNSFCVVLAGRAYFSAPEIDGRIYFNAPEAEEGKEYDVVVSDVSAPDLFGATKDYSA